MFLEYDIYWIYSICLQCGYEKKLADIKRIQPKTAEPSYEQKQTELRAARAERDREIKRLADDGCSIGAIAFKFKLSKTRIKAIIAMEKLKEGIYVK